jgi:hypothetical protein
MARIQAIRGDYRRVSLSVPPPDPVQVREIEVTRSIRRKGGWTFWRHHRPGSLGIPHQHLLTAKVRGRVRDIEVVHSVDREGRRRVEPARALAGDHCPLAPHVLLLNPAHVVRARPIGDMETARRVHS